MKTEFGPYVRAKRIEAGRGLREFARELNCSPTYMSQFERGLSPAPSVAKVIAIAGRLNLDTDELLARAGRVAPDIIAALIADPQICKRIRTWRRNDGIEGNG